QFEPIAMDDAALIRKTIRNCTAVLVAAIGIGVAILAPLGEDRLGAMMAGAAVLYLSPTLLVGLGKRMDEFGSDTGNDRDDPGDSERTNT
uniref:hypothetical protein n=1 Tax=Halobellus sp. EA9 TaxID=3421647 RepID=UPI003EBE14C5